MQDDDFKPLQPVDLTPTERVSELADRGNLIHASNDVEAVVAWLLEYRNHPKPTRAAYYRQAQRLLLWLRHKAHKTLREMGREDWREYEDFMLDPQPEDVWCGPSRPRSHPEWRPFRGPLDRSSHRTAMSILNGMVGFLVEAGYLKANPLSLRRMRHVESRPKVERFLDEKAWDAIVMALEDMPGETAKEREEYERLRFLLIWIELTGARVSDLTGARMGDVQQARTGDTRRWWWHVVGKGAKESAIPVADDALNALMRYRKSLGLPPLPSPDEEMALVKSRTRNAWSDKPMARSSFYQILKALFVRAAELVQDTDPVTARRLRAASPHWLRHTTGTGLMEDAVDLRVASRIMRHSKIDTTMAYTHVDEDRMHRAANRTSSLTRRRGDGGKDTG